MIFPLKDSMPARNRAYATWLIIAVSFAVFVYQQTLSPEELRLFITENGLVPARLPSGARELASYIFLHSNWLHIIGNMWVFFIFSDAVEDVTGPVRLVAFYLVCGIVAGIAHSIAGPSSVRPVIGGSGAVSGILGAYFLLYPHTRVTTFIFFAILDVPAVLYLGGWFIAQFYAALHSGTSGGVAWWAHFGGFIAGVILFPLFRRNSTLPVRLPAPPPREVYDPKDPWARLRSK